MKKTAILAFLLITTLNTVFSQSSPQQIIDSLNNEKQKEFLKLADPATGKIPYEELEKAREEIAKNTSGKQPSAAISPTLTWYERGPKGTAGNVRCITKDPNDVTGKKYWAGAASGGLWYNDDVTNANSAWNQVAGGDNWASINISSIVFNPANTQEMYVGTGNYFDFESGVGSGIYKSTNGGITFTRLSSTIPNSAIIGTLAHAFQYITKLAINNSGHVFASTWNGLLKSSDGGSSWVFLLNSQIGSDLEIGNDGIIYAAFGYGFNSARIYRSDDASGNTWLDISPNTTGSRTEIALANSPNVSSQVMYAFASSGNVIWFKKTVDGGNNWTNIPIPLSPYSNTTDFLSYYGGTMTVHPSNSDVVFAAGGYLIKSINGGLNWTVSTNSYSGANGIVVGNDLSSLVMASGSGVYYSSNSGNLTSASTNMMNINAGFKIHNSTSVAMNNIAEDGNILGGTLRVNSALHTLGTVTGAFGFTYGNVFIDQDNPNIIISNHYLYNSNLSFITNLASSSNNVSDYDSPNNIFYIFKTVNSGTTTFEKATGVGVVNISNLISSFNVSTQMSPSFLRVGKSANTIFVGAEQGKLYMITNIDTSPVATRIDNNLLPTSNAQFSSIDIGATDNEILVTFSNYGVSSVWYTTDGGTTWINKDAVGHGLPNIPVRHAKLIRLSPSDSPKVVLATELGVFTTNNIQDANPAWEVSNSGLPNVRCNWIYYRTADSVLAVATQGRGMFTSPMRGFVNPSINNEFSKLVLCKSGSSNVPFSILGTFPSGTVFNVELSNSSGSFTAPTVIGSGTVSPISITLPSNLTSSSTYKVRIVTVAANPKISNESAAFNVKSTSELFFSLVNFNNITPINGAYNFCEGSNVSVVYTSSSINNANLLPYTWSGPNGFTSFGNTLNLTNATASSVGTYTVTSTIESCQTYTATTQLALTNTPLVNAYAGSSSYCPTTTANLFSNPKVFPSGTVSYLWSGPNNFSSTAQNPSISSVSVNATGIYTVTASFTGSCNGTATATTLLTVSSTRPLSTFYSGQACNGSTITLISSINTNGLTLTYNWSGPNSFTSSLQNPIISNLSTLNVGVYTATVTYSGSCVGTSTSTINIILYNPGINIGGNNSYCAGSTVTLPASLSVSGLTTQYSWVGPNNFTSTSSTLTLPNLSATNTGSYTVTASYTGACVGTVARTISVNVNSVFIIYSGSTQYCSGETTNLTASLTTSGLTAEYSWAGPNGFTSTGSALTITNFTTANAGSYTITASYSGTCNGTATTSIFLGVSTPAVFSSAGNQYCLGTNGSVSVGYNGPTPTYSWVGPNGFTSTVASPTITNIDASNAGTYTVTAIFGNGCNVTTTATTAITLTTVIPPYSISQSGIGGEYCLNTGSANLSVISITNFSSSNISSVSWTGPNSFSSSSTSLSLSTSNINNSGVYSATVSFIGCVGTATATTNVNISSVPKISAFILSNSNYIIPNIQISKQADVCEGNYFFIEAIPNNGGSATYSWSGPNVFSSTSSFNFILNSISASMAGVYTVTATLTGACAGTATSTVQLNLINSTPPDISVTPENFVVGQPVSLSAANCAGTLKWNYTTATTNPIVLIPTDGQNVYATCNTNGCITGNSRKIVFNNCASSYQLSGNFTNLITRYEASNSITATNKIIPVSNITYDAQNSVMLNPGFEVQAGSVFKAQIDGCGNN